MVKFQEFVPSSSTEVKSSYDKTLGELAEKLWYFMEEDGLIKPTNFRSDGTAYLSRSSEFNPDETKKAFSERTYKFFTDEFLKYLGRTEVAFVKADYLTAVDEEQRNLIHHSSRVPGILPSKSYQGGFWQSGIFHMDYGFDLHQYKFIIYINDVDLDEGGITFTNPLITPYLEDGTPRWEGVQENLKLNVKPIKTEDLDIVEYTGKKGTVVCFNSHIAHSARLPLKGYRKAIHLVVPGPPAKEYERKPHPIYYKEFKN